ncbi:flagellar hook protein FlgE [Rhizobium oryzicola]|uniref:Flagellar hook protein FlgE n=1 Tax=Rhizobium oryzicola TaxID=1232668 RepID=A0ABT8ST32_9HYPH|nr:flagellar hook protein FlgE [Rhizobium oryzicola]MDO1581033.1 flagellar hook protein FlgE [Rhizobium oryzicola]
MSLFGTMRTGVSGMNAQANRLGNVGDNIANANTSGYKKASSSFSSMIMPSAGGSYDSGGVDTTTRYSIKQQGSFSYTTSATDLAINGDGFFIVKSTDGANYMTRAGNFEVQADGTLKNAAGFTLQGYPYSSTTDPTIVINGFQGLSDINVNAGGLKSTPSTLGSMSGNLPDGDATLTKHSSSLVAYDSKGNARTLTVTFEKDATTPDTWNATITAPDNTGAPQSLLASTPITFNLDGTLKTPSKLTTAAFPAATSNVGGDLNAIDIDITGLTEKGAAYSMTGSINGQGASGVDKVQIGKDGVVSILYKNGQSIPTYRIAMANVQSPNNLTPQAGNVYTQSNTSGVVVMGYAGNSGYGEIKSGTLENSNVDIAEELTVMIEAQRNYTANSKVFQTGSELLDVLVNLKR